MRTCPPDDVRALRKVTEFGAPGKNAMRRLSSLGWQPGRFSSEALGTGGHP
jgi:hypothetical protein